MGQKWNDTSVKKKNFGFGFSFSIISCIFALNATS